MTIWLIILGMAIVTYLPRVLPLVAIDADRLPAWVRRGLNYVPIAVLSAIVGTAYLPSPNWGHFIVDERALAGAVAIAVAWWRKDITLTIAGGMLVLLALRAL